MTSQSARRRHPGPLRHHASADPVTAVLLVGGVCLAVVVVLLLAGYVFGWRWTGYRDEKHHDEIRTLWDWLTLLLLPLTLALLPFWLRSGDRGRRSWRALAGAATLAFAVLVVGGYRLGWTWTGFTGNTLWDWLGLFLMPFLLPLVLLLVVERGGRTDMAASGATSPPDPRSSGVGRPPAASGPAAPPAVGSGGRRPGPAGRALPLVVIGAVVLVVGMLLVGAGFALGRASAHPPAAAAVAPAGGRSHPAGPMAVQRVVVVAGDPFWTDTAMAVRRGEVVRVTAFGSVEPHTGPGGRWPQVGPDGRRHRHARNIIGHRHAGLLATVGRPAHQLRLDSKPTGCGPTYVGGHGSFVVHCDGELYLGVNDRKTRDNSGYFGATVAMSLPG
ncbi:MAG TPA: hypothetical protein VFX52_15300 [Nocardioidaceae bacterium]|nr:hypothetical protein [Nocardioidaceae bacterium]